MKIQAYQRIAAMAITQGDNYFRGMLDAKKFLEYPISAYTILNYSKEEGLALLRGIQGNSEEFILVTTKSNFPMLFKNKKEIISYAAKNVVATISLYVTSSGSDVITSWVDTDYRGKGFGKSLYKVAYFYAKKKLMSSDDLGTMSLAVWLSLYKEFKKVYILYMGEYRGRKDIRVEGLKIFDVKYGELTSPKTKDFLFVWPK